MADALIRHVTEGGWHIRAGAGAPSTSAVAAGDPAAVAGCS